MDDGTRKVRIGQKYLQAKRIKTIIKNCKENFVINIL